VILVPLNRDWTITRESNGGSASVKKEKPR
jgi:hypothetical protein